MVSQTNNPRLLLKLKSAKSLSASGSNNAKIAFGSIQLEAMLTPLFEENTNLGLTEAAHKWWVADIKLSGLDDKNLSAPKVNAWDICHNIITQGKKIKGSTVEFAEPDIEHKWEVDYAPSSSDAVGFAAAPGPDDPDKEPDTRYNHFNAKDWFRNDRHTGFDKARASHGNIADKDRVRIAHFDTGYDPDHKTLPRHIETKLERNFVDKDRPNSAIDQTEGMFTNLGHGTGTLGILAGKAWGKTGVSKLDLGGAPFAKIVPIRVANSVVLFRTSAIAKAFDYITSLSKNADTRVDIITMSMGGLASQAWAEAVNRAYDAGIFIVTASGNNFDNLPTRFMVYPARFNRVVAACGVQARAHPTKFDPYADLPRKMMAGNYGPDSKVDEAMAAFTPNIPWARIHSGDKMNFSGGGTSAATPQIAAAAANWIQKNRKALDKYQHGWQRVEAIRHALFESATSWKGEEKFVRKFFGQGILDANAALSIAPVDASKLKEQGKDSARFAFIRGFAGLGIDKNLSPVSLDMIGLEITQLAQVSPLLAQTIEDWLTIDDPLERIQALKNVLAEVKGTSLAVRNWLGANVVTKATELVPQSEGSEYYKQIQIEHAKNPDIAKPAVRLLRVYSSDPSIAANLSTIGQSEIVINLPWRDVKPGPIDEYFEVIDIDPSSKAAYAPIDLNNANFLATDGVSPSESDPRFHQQMVYAVASKTVRHFENALGRPALWSPRQVQIGGQIFDQFVRRLRIYPHALREANAYYSPSKKALMFGYFKSETNAAGAKMSTSTVFSCLSYDIVAHETAHALLDGLHGKYAENTHGDTGAFHEAFSDIVALFQHFTHPDVLHASITRVGSEWKDFAKEITNLAYQFGQAIGYHGALRSALGTRKRKDENGKEFEQFMTLNNVGNEVHDRGAVLVAAMFDTFTQIYHTRSADLMRIASQGTGVLPDGKLHPDLVKRLADEAARSASHMLRMAIRALDYCPPVGLTFGEYLRAMITSDIDLYPDDTYGYRTALVMSFRARGVHPDGVSTVTADSLKWYAPNLRTQIQDEIAGVIMGLDKDYGLRSWKLETDRQTAFDISKKAARKLTKCLHDILNRSEHGEEEAYRLGFTLKDKTEFEILGNKQAISAMEVHSVRPARRKDANGQESMDVIVDLTQSLKDLSSDCGFIGGATWIVNADTGRLRYIIHKRILNAQRILDEYDFRMKQREERSNSYFASKSDKVEPFALTHRNKVGDET